MASMERPGSEFIGLRRVSGSFVHREVDSIHEIGSGGEASDIAVPGDYDEDDMADLAIDRRTAGAGFIYASSTGPSRIYGVGFIGDPFGPPC